MTREEANDILPILQAFAEGKAIESRCIKGEKSLWYDDDDLSFDDDLEYRIKPEPKYRPFTNAKECWQEMLKHQPFGWVKFQGDWFLVVHIDDKSIGYGSACGVIMHSKFDDILKSFTFANGTPFGILEEE